MHAEMRCYRACAPGRTPLLHAVAERVHIDVITMLLEARADPNLSDDSLTTPMHVAASRIHILQVLHRSSSARLSLAAARHS